MNRFILAALLAGSLLLGACDSSTTTGQVGQDQPAADSAATVGTAAAGCRPPAPFTIRHPAWATSASLYQVNLRQYTPEGTFRAFEQQLPRLQKMGVGILWLMPVQPIGRLRRKGTLGSQYSLSNYDAVNPEFGTEADLRHLLGEAHRLATQSRMTCMPSR